MTTMGLVGKKQTAGRFSGWIIITVGLILTCLFDLFYLANPFSIIGIIIFIPILIFSLKSHLEIFEKHNQLFAKLITFLIPIYGIIFHYYLFYSWDNLIKFSFVILSEWILVFSWHYTLSIKKNQKIFQVIAFCIYVISSIFFKLDILIGQFNNFNVIPIVIVSVGFACNILSEYNMRKKGLMKYI